jgi:hypothetical protein
MDPQRGAWLLRERKRERETPPLPQKSKTKRPIVRFCIYLYAEEKLSDAEQWWNLIIFVYRA